MTLLEHKVMIKKSMKVKAESEVILLEGRVYPAVRNDDFDVLL